MTQAASIGMKDPVVREGKLRLHVQTPTSEPVFLCSHQKERACVKTHFILMKLPEIVQLSHTL